MSRWRRAHPAVLYGRSVAERLRNSCVAWWNFGEASGSLLDATGRGNTGSDTNTVTSTTGLIGTARQFTAASSEYFFFSDSADLSVAAGVSLTFSFWVYADSFGQDRYVINKQQSSLTKAEYTLYYEHATTRFRWQMFDSAANSIGIVRADTFGAPGTATWLHLLAKYDASVGKIYLKVNNGTADEATLTGTPADSAANAAIGAYAWSLGSGYWNGRMDLGGAFRKVTSDSEDALLYHGGAGYRLF